MRACRSATLSERPCTCVPMVSRRAPEAAEKSCVVFCTADMDVLSLFTASSDCSMSVRCTAAFCVISVCMFCWPWISWVTPVCSSMISRATAPAGAGPSNAPPRAPASMAEPKNRIHRVRKVFLLRGGTPRSCLKVSGARLKPAPLQNPQGWGTQGLLSPRARILLRQLMLLAHDDVRPAILLPALFRGSRAERTFLCRS
jgi:hypothetical protein